MRHWQPPYLAQAAAVTARSPVHRMVDHDDRESTTAARPEWTWVRPKSSALVSDIAASMS